MPRSNRAQKLNGLFPLSYMGVIPTSPGNFIIEYRPPTSNDSKNYYIGDLWLDNSSINASPSTPPAINNLWILVSLSGNLATWRPFGQGTLQTLTGNSGGPVSPDINNNINVVGDGTTVDVVGNPATNTLTVSVTGIFAATYDGDIGFAVPAAYTLNIITDNAANNAGASTLFNASGNTVQLNVTDADFNTFIGRGAGNLALTVGDAIRNTGIGYDALSAITTGEANTAVGYDALNANTVASNNTALGHAAMFVNVDSSTNTAVGANAMQTLASGSGSNTAVGVQALRFLVSGESNIGIGVNAGALYNAGESSNIVISSNVNSGVPGDNNTIRIGYQGSGVNEQDTAYMAGIAGVTVSNPLTVVINSATGQLGTSPSAGTNVTVMGTGGSPENDMFPVGTMHWIAPFSTQSGVTKANAQIVIPTSGTIGNLYVYVFANSSTTNNTCTLNVNGVNTTLVATVTALTTGVFSDTIHSVAVVAGDLIQFECTGSTGGDALANLTCTFTA